MIWLAELLHSVGTGLITASDFLQIHFAQGSSPSADYFSQLFSIALLLFSGWVFVAVYKRWQMDRERYRHWLSAMMRMDDIIASDSQNAVAYWVKGELFEMNTQYREAQRCYRKAHELCPAAYSYSEWRDAARRLQTYLDGTAVPYDQHWPLHSYSI